MSGDLKVTNYRICVVDLDLWVEISKSQIWELVCSISIIEESVDSEPRIVMWVSTTKDSSIFRVKSIVKTSILLVNCCPVDCLD